MKSLWRRTLDRRPVALDAAVRALFGRPRPTPYSKIDGLLDGLRAIPRQATHQRRGGGPRVGARLCETMIEIRNVPHAATVRVTRAMLRDTTALPDIKVTVALMAGAARARIDREVMAWPGMTEEQRKGYVWSTVPMGSIEHPLPW